MRIKNIIIKNYRSIEELILPIKSIANKSCFIFLGKNESGKSNIINAISLINEGVSFDYNLDCNKSSKKKKEDIKITIELELQETELLKGNNTLINIPDKIKDILSIKKIEKSVLIDSNNKIKHVLNIEIDENEIFKKYVYNDVLETVKEIKEVYKGKYTINDNNISTYIGKNYSILKKSNLEKIISKKVINFVNSNVSKCILWKPSPSYLINDSIDLNRFAENNEISIPLKNIFRICGIKDIKSRIMMISNDIEERAQLKQELSDSITSYVNKVWPEHPIKIFVEIESMSCTVMIEDKDNSLPKYKMNQRSDGFKQFFSILLNLSIENDINEIKNKIILLDEPEVHIHPSGVKYLRDELLKISENNIVIISTHSIYLVDKLNLERHFKVEKVKSVTTINQIDKDNPYEEEVIYEALGTSIYEHVQPNMLIFEGKTDKDVFDGFTNKFKMELKPSRIGSISADGVEKIPQYTKFIDGKMVKGFVVVDSDSDGKKVKDNIIKDNINFNQKNTFEINDIYDTKKLSTLEDLYPKDYIIYLIDKHYKVVIELDSSPVVKQIEKRNSTLGGRINIKELKGILVQEILKDITKLTKEKTKEKYKVYYDFVESLHKKIN